MNKDKTIKNLKERNHKLANQSGQHELREYQYFHKCEQLETRIDKAINKVQYIIDLGFDYDGFENSEDLKKLIDALVDYAKKTKEILKGEKNENTI